MELSNLPKITKKTLRRLGQGHGSGRGKTSGRGTKGQKARNSVPLAFEGGALPLVKRIPFLRGRGRNAAGAKRIAVTLSDLNRLPQKSEVDVALLVKLSIVHKQAAIVGVKIINTGELTVPLTIKVPVTQGAKEVIEKAGGQVITV